MDTKNLDIIYVLKPDIQNEEFRYSLRSLKNLPHRNVWVYGGAPSWISNEVKMVQQEQSGIDKWHKSNSSFVEACRNKEISDDFIFFNDDFFVWEPCEKLDYFYYGTLDERIAALDGKFRRRSSYGNTLFRTKELLNGENKPTLNYALHIPMIFNKKKVLELAKKFPGEIVSRSLYANYYQLGGEKRPDCKIYINRGHIPRNQDFCSTTNGSFRMGDVGRDIKLKFKEKSIYEF